MPKKLHPRKVAQAISLLFLCFFTTAFSQTLGPYPVIRVVDGDTIRVEIDGENVPVRLIGIDTPETVHPFKPVEPYGPEASALLRRLLAGQEVMLEPDVQLRDRYGRLLAYAYLEDGRQANLLMVQAGLARTLTIPPNVRYTHLYRAASAGARSVGKGLWADLEEPFRDRNCSDFATQPEAQAFFEGAQPGNPHRLDWNRNGVACQALLRIGGTRAE